MTLKKKLLLNTKLYLVASVTDSNQFNVIYNKSKKTLSAGVKILQLRCKNINDSTFFICAQRFRKLTKAYRALLIINDRVDIAYNCKADGVHLGQDDLDIIYARSILGKNKIIGRSTHNKKQAQLAQQEGADYIGFGPIFKTTTKPNTKPIGLKSIGFLNKNIRIPFFLIGGINTDNIAELISLKAKRVAVTDAILAKNNSFQAAIKLQKILQ